jgi:hypothetical protein
MLRISLNITISVADKLTAHNRAWFWRWYSISWTEISMPFMEPGGNGFGKMY